MQLSIICACVHVLAVCAVLAMHAVIAVHTMLARTQLVQAKNNNPATATRKRLRPEWDAALAHNSSSGTMSGGRWSQPVYDLLISQKQGTLAQFVCKTVTDNGHGQDMDTDNHRHKHRQD